MVRKITNLFIVVLLGLVMMSCTTTVRRVSADKDIDLTGNWNDIDVGIVSDSLVSDALDTLYAMNIRKMHAGLPLIVVGKFQNQSDEHLDTSILTSKMRNAIIKSGRADFLASSANRENLRAERIDQMSWADESQAKSIANEDAADYMIQGSIKTIVQKSGNKSVRTYFVYAELVDIETGRIVWTGENSEIKKVVTAASIRW